MACLLVIAGGVATASSAGAPAGPQQIFQSKCAKCHGPSGEGTADHAATLEGDLSVAELTKLIGETMPEDNPGSLSPAAATW